MPLTFATVPLPLMTAEVDLHLRQWHPNYDDFEDANVWGYAADGLEHLPLPPPPLDEPFEVGKLVWPTGMTRCAVGRYVVDSESFDDIRTQLGSSAGPATLTISDGTTSQDFSLYLVNYRPLFQIDNQNQLYLITLADKRWFLRTMTGSVSSTPASWTSLFSTLATALGITLTPDTVAADYGDPTDRWVVYEKPLSVLLDAAAAAVGHRVVALTDGTFTTVTADTARTDSDNLYGDYDKTCGGFLLSEDLPRSVPASVKVVFNHSGGDEPHTVTKSLADLSITDYGSAAGVTGQVATVNGELAYDGTNDTACEDYAEQAATDWYTWHLCDVDVTYAGVADWTPTGAEDRIEWRYQADRILTRVVRPPMQVLPMGTYDDGGGEATGACEGCGWAAALDEDDCIKITFLSAGGRCGCADEFDPVYLSSDDGLSWTSETTVHVCGVDYTLTFTKGDCDGPCLTLSHSGGSGSGDATATCENGEWVECCPDDCLSSTGTLAFSNQTGTCSLTGGNVTFGNGGWRTDSDVASGWKAGLSCVSTPNAPDVWSATVYKSDFSIVYAGELVSATCGGDVIFDIDFTDDPVVGSAGPPCSGTARLTFNILATVSEPVGDTTQPQIGDDYVATRECCGCNYATFAVGDPEVCTDDKATGGPCNNILKVRAEWSLCWDGPGWYCIRPAGAIFNDCIPAELTDLDFFDNTIEICSGPYATEEDALAACPNAGVTVCAGQAHEDTIPTYLWVKLTNTTDSYTQSEGRIGTFNFAASGPYTKWFGCFAHAAENSQTALQIEMDEACGEASPSVLYGSARVGYPTATCWFDGISVLGVTPLAYTNDPFSVSWVHTDEYGSVTITVTEEYPG